MTIEYRGMFLFCVLQSPTLPPGAVQPPSPQQSQSPMQEEAPPVPQPAKAPPPTEPPVEEDSPQAPPQPQNPTAAQTDVRQKLMADSPPPLPTQNQVRKFNLFYIHNNGGLLAFSSRESLLKRKENGAWKLSFDRDFLSRLKIVRPICRRRPVKSR